MASSPLITTPTSLDDLPPQFRRNLTQYLGEHDLGTVRLLSAFWNTTAKATLRKRKPFNFNITNTHKLAKYNATFSAYTPTEDIAAGRFCFKISVFENDAAAVHLDTFAQGFGHLVTTLSVNLSNPRPVRIIDKEKQYWFDDTDKRDTVLGHVTLLLQGVKGHVQALDLFCCAGLGPCVIGDDPFPRLTTLTVRNDRLPIASSLPLAMAQEEACILLLSGTVPAIKRFEFQPFHCSARADPFFVVKVLRNLVTVNGAVEVKLDMEIPFERSGMLRVLMTVPVRVVEVDLGVIESIGALRVAFNWIKAQSDWLKKLTFTATFDEYEYASLGSVTLPSLKALEELDYAQTTMKSLLKYTAADDFPNLRKVTTAVTASVFTVALPQVTDLTVNRTRFTELVPWQQGIYGAAAFRLPPFPNLEALTCPVKFIDLGSIVQLKNLRRLTLTRDEGNTKVHSFWKRVANGATRLTLEQIRAIPEPSEDEVRKRAEPCFSDLTNLREFKMAVDQGELTLVNLDALLWLSKTKRLQRLQKLEFEDKYLSTTLAVPEVYLTELRNYHNSVMVSYAK